MKNVLAISYLFPPDHDSGSLRNLKILKYLPSQGWDVQLLTHRAPAEDLERAKTLVEEIPVEMSVIRTRYIDTHQMFGSLRSSLSLRKRRSKTESGSASSEAKAAPLTAEGAASAGSSERTGIVSRIKDFITHCFSIPDRRMGWLPFAIPAGFGAMRRHRADVIYAVGRPWTAFFVGYVLKVLFRKPLVIDFMDPWCACTWSWSKPRIFQWIDRRLEHFVCRRADFIVANTDTLRDDFIERLGIPPHRVGVVTCGYDAADFQTDSSPETSLESDDKFVVTHTGSFYKRRSPLSFLQAVKRLLEKDEISPSNFHVYLVGRNSVRDPELKAILQESWVPEVVTFVPWIPHEEVINYLMGANLLLLIQPDTKLQIPAKLYEYAATRKPVLALSDVDGAVDRIVQREQWGEVVGSDDVDAIEGSLRTFIEKHRRGELAGNPCGADHYTTEALAKKLSGYLHEVLPTPTTASESRRASVEPVRAADD